MEPPPQAGAASRRACCGQGYRNPAGPEAFRLPELPNSAAVVVKKGLGESEMTLSPNQGRKHKTCLCSSLAMKRILAQVSSEGRVTCLSLLAPGRYSEHQGQQEGGDGGKRTDHRPQD